VRLPFAAVASVGCMEPEVVRRPVNIVEAARPNSFTNFVRIYSTMPKWRDGLTLRATSI
jgi:hypothetical protein